MEQQSATSAPRCGTAAGASVAIGSVAPTIFVSEPQNDLSLALSLVNDDILPSFYPGAVPSDVNVFRRDATVHNTFLLFNVGDVFGGVAELIPLTAKCEQPILRVRLFVTMVASTWRREILRQVIEYLWARERCDKVVMFVHAHESAGDCEAAGFIEEGLLRRAEYHEGVWSDIRVFGATRDDWTTMPEDRAKDG